MQLVGNLIINFKGAMDLRLLLLLLTSISTIMGRETHTKNGIEMKVIQAEYGADEFDCVDIHKQPAFSHPLLKNHKIQMNPSFSKNLGRNEVNPFNMPGTGLRGEGCPSGKVPIQRKKANTSFHKFSSRHPGQHVHPRLYGDTVTRLTTYWTKDNYQRTGCYNIQCPGFVQIHSQFHVGQRVGNSSTYGGQGYELNVLIKQDIASGNWWLIVKEDVEVGYWPKEIFSHLQEGATDLQYGGWVFVSPDGNSPPMGNGHLPTNDTNKFSYIRDMKFVDSSNQEFDLVDNKTHTYFDTRCYYVIYWYYQGSYWRKLITFGGPGGQCGI